VRLPKLYDPSDDNLVFGGIKATFLTDYAHTVVILIIILLFAFTAYATNDNLGSPSGAWELLQEASKRHPVEGNAGGSYLTMRSKEGAIFFVIKYVLSFNYSGLADIPKHCRQLWHSLL
jgi:Na+/proline symporter